MTIEQQVVSIELVQLLQKLGVKQESLFYWVRNADDNGYTLYYRKTGKPDFWVDFYSAFTVAELDEILNGYYASYKGNAVDILLHRGTNNPADYRAQILIYLLENNLITL